MPLPLETGRNISTVGFRGCHCGSKRILIERGLYPSPSYKHFLTCLSYEVDLSRRITSTRRNLGKRNCWLKDTEHHMMEECNLEKLKKLQWLFSGMVGFKRQVLAFQRHVRGPAHHPSCTWM